MSKPLYKRILLKLSGEALVAPKQNGLNAELLFSIADDIVQIAKAGVQIGIVVGGGNFLRGKNLVPTGIRQINADHMGMLATLMNGIALQDVLQQKNQLVSVMSAIPVQHSLMTTFSRTQAMHLLDAGMVLVFVGGTGHPFVTTDSAASLRAIEIEADILLKGTQVDGVYSADPNLYPDAKRYDHVSYEDVLKDHFGVMDNMAFQQCQQYQMPIRVFNIQRPNALWDVIHDQSIGTTIDNK